MDGRRLLALSVLAFVFGCQDQQVPTGLKAPESPSASLSDGGHGDNADFFFLPPLLKLKKNNPNFQLGAFNNTLQSRLRIDICELNTSTLPTDDTQCIGGAPLKTFAHGDINLVNLPTDRKDVPKPFHHEEWSKGAHGPTDGFYYVLWDTGQQPGLSLEKFYRIKVVLEPANVGSDFVLGFADVDPKAKGGPKWKYSRTKDLIEMVDDVKLPIPFRVENIGGNCVRADYCAQATINNGDGDPNTFQFVRVDGGLGAIAGARFPDGWLPAGGPQSVVVTIFEIPSETAEDGTRITPCHAGLPLQQFNKCFRFITTPTLATDRNGDQFAEFVTIAVCYTLEESGDPREKFAEIWASGPNEQTRPLPDVSDAGILGLDDSEGPGPRACETAPFLTLDNLNPLTRLASSGWRVLKGGLKGLFGVKTAYAVDLGLGGIVKGFSNFGPAVSATIEAYPNPAGTTHVLTLVSGVATANVRIVGNHSHGEASDFTGINGMPVTFTLAPNNGILDDGEGSGPEVTRITSTLFFNDESSADGIATVDWVPPVRPGTYHMTASGPTTNGPVEFSVVVPKPPPVALGALQGSWFNAADLETFNVRSLFFSVDGEQVFVSVTGRCENGEEASSCGWAESVNADVTRWANHQEITFVADEGFATKTITVKYIDATHIRATTLTHFTDSSGRANYTTTETLQLGD